MCKIHENRPIEYYCEDDDMIICSRCVIVGSHKGHNISSIEDKVRYQTTDHFKCNVHLMFQLFPHSIFP